jgi:hypothetical protein
MALPWKGSIRQRIEGSNPSFSANNLIGVLYDALI